MHIDTLKQMWNRAAEMDATLRLPSRDFAALAAKQVLATVYTRSRLFKHMVKGEVSLFRNLPILLKGDNGKNTREVLVQAIRNGFDKTKRARVQLGRERQRSYISINRLLEKWHMPESIVSTTDLHFRETGFEDHLAADVLSDFNLLCVNRQNVLPLEMMTLVVGSEGNVTESHSDDSDGSNHCFVGKKLWLAWDRQEGKAAGLQDVTHDEVYGQAAFTMKDFLKLSSSRWWIVAPGQTLFLPGNLTHKVVTLESYIGFGSFHVAFPAYFRTLTRWILYETTDVTANVLRVINDLAIEQLRRLKRANPQTQEQWGIHHLPVAYHFWKSQELRNRQTVQTHPVFRSFIEAAFH